MFVILSSGLRRCLRLSVSFAIIVLFVHMVHTYTHKTCIQKYSKHTIQTTKLI